MSEFVLRSARFLAKEYFEKVVIDGSVVVDATMGNGYDTLLLAKLVGEAGHVYAFDVQQQALDETKKRLIENELAHRATLFLCGHHRLIEHVPQQVDAVVFNLGWLPGGDKGVTTQLNTTLQAVEQALTVLKPMGVLIMCVYPGHDEGQRELESLQSFFSNLLPQQFNCLEHVFLNAGQGAPRCFVVQKQQG